MVLFCLLSGVLPLFPIDLPALVISDLSHSPLFYILYLCLGEYAFKCIYMCLDVRRIFDIIAQCYY